MSDKKTALDKKYLEQSGADKLIENIANAASYLADQCKKNDANIKTAINDLKKDLIDGADPDYDTFKKLENKIIEVSDKYNSNDTETDNAINELKSGLDKCVKYGDESNLYSVMLRQDGGSDVPFINITGTEVAKNKSINIGNPGLGLKFTGNSPLIMYTYPVPVENSDGYVDQQDNIVLASEMRNTVNDAISVVNTNFSGSVHELQDLIDEQAKTIEDLKSEINTLQGNLSALASAFETFLGKVINTDNLSF